MSVSSKVPAAVLLVFAMALPTAYAFGVDMPRWWTGVPAWLAGVLIWQAANRRAAVQSAVLALIGVLGLAWGAWHEVALGWEQVLAANALIIAMLASVSFLRLVVATAGEGDGAERGAAAKTALGIHLFGSVINMSIVYIVAQRLTGGRNLEDRQVMLLTRCFGAAAFWSPFFAAMGVALTYAPGAELSALMAGGIPLALVAIVITVLQVEARSESPFVGYPLNFAGLALPAVLAGLVIGINDVRPEIPVIAIICLIVPPISILGASLRGRRGLKQTRTHFLHELPNMPNELLLFLAAGVMSAGLAAVFASLGDWMPWSSFGPLQAAILLGINLVLALLGVHPVIAIAVGSALILPLQPAADLLAMTFLCTWAIGVAISPLSGMNLALSGRFGLRAGQVLRINWPYGLVMYLAAALMLQWV